MAGSTNAAGSGAPVAVPAAPSSSARLWAGVGLMIIQTAVGILYKASQAATGGFRYSTTSAITIAECLKLILSLVFLARHCRNSDKDTWSSVWQHLSAEATFQIWIVAFLYAFNNQLSFYTYKFVDPGTIFLFKSASTLIVAFVQRSFVGKVFTHDQWRAMALQACGMVVVQYDPCAGKPIHEPFVYICMGMSTFVTGVVTARNEYIVKNYEINLHVQNATLYAGGFLMNLVAFFLLPNPNSAQASLGFFDGYDDPLALGVVFSNALIGVAITAVYKYADAIVKCIAGDITAVLLCIMSTFFFGLRTTVTTWCGVGVVCTAVHLYVGATRIQQQQQHDQQADRATLRTSAETTKVTNGSSNLSSTGAEISTKMSPSAPLASEVTNGNSKHSSAEAKISAQTPLVSKSNNRADALAAHLAVAAVYGGKDLSAARKMASSLVTSASDSSAACNGQSVAPDEGASRVGEENDVDEGYREQRDSATEIRNNTFWLVVMFILLFVAATSCFYAVIFHRRCADTASVDQGSSSNIRPPSAEAMVTTAECFEGLSAITSRAGTVPQEAVKRCAALLRELGASEPSQKPGKCVAGSDSTCSVSVA